MSDSPLHDNTSSWLWTFCKTTSSCPQCENSLCGLFWLPPPWWPDVNTPPQNSSMNLRQFIVLETKTNEHFILLFDIFIAQISNRVKSGKGKSADDTIFQGRACRYFVKLISIIQPKTLYRTQTLHIMHISENYNVSASCIAILEIRNRTVNKTWITTPDLPSCTRDVGQLIQTPSRNLPICFTRGMLTESMSACRHTYKADSSPSHPLFPLRLFLCHSLFHFFSLCSFFPSSVHNWNLLCLSITSKVSSGAFFFYSLYYYSTLSFLCDSSSTFLHNLLSLFTPLYLSSFLLLLSSSPPPPVQPSSHSSNCVVLNAGTWSWLIF